MHFSFYRYVPIAVCLFCAAAVSETAWQIVLSPAQQADEAMSVMLEQPSPENDYTVRIYLDDMPGGNGWMIFDLYYIPEPPESLGLQIPWTG